ncbi:MAG: hypothetical protein LAP85_10900 [Acidobacteriia bacterium]|nr:hypothetical protein [Terriglobia bacterium]
MLRALIRSLGVDYEQWRALTRIYLRMDLRTASLGQFSYERAGKSEGSYKLLFFRLWVYLFMGAGISALVYVNKDVFFTGTLLLTYTMLMTAMLVLVDFGAVVISPDDFAILGYQPVSSRTYFITRLTNVLVYAILLTLALGVIPVLVFFITLGFRPLLGLAALLATLLSGVGMTLFLVLIYTGILRLIHPNKLRRAVSYIQLILSFLIYGGYIFLPRLMEAGTFTTMTLKKSAGVLWYPPTWFASYLDLAVGRRRAVDIVPALLSVAVLGLLAQRARGRLALEYSDRLSSATAVSEGPKKISRSATRPALIFKSGEARAVALLVRNQFKYDQKFRLAVLSILPLTVLYLFMGLRHGPLPDPFVSHENTFNDSFLLYLAVLMFPTMLRITLVSSDSYQASWIYYATPADRGRLVLGSKDFVFTYFVLPYLIFIGAVFLYFFHNPWHVILHLTVLALLSHFFLQMAVFLNPALPFSQPSKKGQRSGQYLITLMFGPFAAIGLLLALSRWVYPNMPLLLVVLAGFAGSSWLLERALRARVRRRTASLEYQD